MSPASSDAPFASVTLARILRPHGRRGEVAAEILTAFPARLPSLREAYLWDGTTRRRVAVRSCWLSRSRGGQAIFHFEGCTGITDAQQLRGLEVQIPLSERMPLPAGQYYISDLAGCEVWQRSEPNRAAIRLGWARDVQFIGEETPGVPLLVVDTPNGELLVPLAEAVCTDIDTARRRIDVILPEGLRELNRD